MLSLSLRSLVHATRAIHLISKSRSRGYAVITGEALREKTPQRSSDLGWIVAAAAVFVPTMAYLMSPQASQHSSTSHAHPVPNRWSRSFALEDLKPENLNRPIMADDDGIVPAGEGRPHGSGDRSLRQLTKPTETHAANQVLLHKHDHEKAQIPEKMDQARAHAVAQAPHSTGIDTKIIVADAHVDHQVKHG